MYTVHFSLVVVMEIVAFQRIVQQAGIKKTGSEVNHISGLVAAKAIITFVHLHGRMLVMMEWIAGYAAAADPELIVFSRLSGGDGCPDKGKQIRLSHRASLL